MEPAGPHERVLLDVTDGIAELRLASPAKRNCFSLELAEDLYEGMASIRERDDVRVVLVTADGPAFSAGADLDIVATDAPEALERLKSLYDPVFDWMHWSDVPVIAAARGPVVGAGGSLLCYAADLRVVTPSVELWWPEAEHGIVPLSLSVYLATQIGRTRTLELMLLGRAASMTAEEGRGLGLFNRVVEDEHLEATVREMAEQISALDAGIAAVFLEVLDRAECETGGASAAYATRRRDEFERATGTRPGDVR